MLARGAATAPLTVAILDEEASSRSSIARGLRLTPGFVIVGEASTPHAALDLIRGLEPDAALIGALPPLGGPEMCAEVGALRPRPGTRLVVLSPVLEPAFVARALVAGAAAFLGRDASGEDIARTLRRIELGRRTAPGRTAA